MTLSYIIFESCWGYEGHSKIIDHCLARFYISLMELRCRLLSVGPPRLPVRHTLLTLLQPNCLSVFQYWFLHFSILRISQIRRLGRGDQVGRLRDRGEAEGSKTSYSSCYFTFEFCFGVTQCRVKYVACS